MTRLSKGIRNAVAIFSVAIVGASGCRGRNGDQKATGQEETRQAQLLRVTTEASALMRRDAALALRDFPTSPVIKRLVELLSDADRDVRLVAQDSLGVIGQPAVPALTEAMKSESAATRGGALSPFELKGLRSEAAVTPMIELLKREGLWLLAGDRRANGQVLAVGIKALGAQGSLAVAKLEAAIASTEDQYQRNPLEFALLEARKVAAAEAPPK
jgi:HEAT repeat protein